MRLGNNAWENFRLLWFGLSEIGQEVRKEKEVVMSFRESSNQLIAVANQCGCGQDDDFFMICPEGTEEHDGKESVVYWLRDDSNPNPLIYLPKDPNVFRKRASTRTFSELLQVFVICKSCGRVTVFSPQLFGWEVIPPKGWRKHVRFRWSNPVVSGKMGLRNFDLVEMGNRKLFIPDTSSHDLDFTCGNWRNRIVAGFIESRRKRSFAKVLDQVSVAMLGELPGIITRANRRERLLVDVVKDAILALESTKTTTRSKALGNLRRGLLYELFNLGYSLEVSNLLLGRDIESKTDVPAVAE